MLTELRLAWKSRKENPLVQYGAPWRRGILVAGTYYLVLLAFATGLLTLVVGTIAPKAIPLNMQEEHLFLVFYHGPLVVPAVMIFFIPRWRTHDRISELALSRMSGTEAAFGMIYWGVTTSLRLTLGVMFYLSGSLLFDQLRTGYSLSLFDVLIFACLPFSFALLAHVIAIRQWLRTPRRPWTAVFSIPFRMVLPGIVFTVYWLLATNVFGVDPFTSSTRMLSSYFIVGAVFFIPMTAILLWYLRQAFTEADAFIFAHARPMEFLRADWRQSSLALRALPKQKRRFPWRFFKVVRRGFFINLLIQFFLIGTALLLFTIAGQSQYRGPDWQMYFLLAYLLAPLATIAGILPLVLLQKDGRLPLVGGSAMGSILPYAIPHALVQGIIFVCISYAEPLRSSVRWVQLVATLFIGLGSTGGLLLVTMITAAMVLPRHHRRRWALCLGALSALGVSGFIVRDNGFFGEVFLAVVLILPGTLYVLLLEVFLDRLHRLELSRVPVLTITTEWDKPEPPLEPMPDGYFKV